MNAKWYASTLIIILALLGLNQEQSKVANQQIVLQFVDEAMASEATCDNALVSITKSLKALGIADIEVVESNDNQISIRYYSDINALDVKAFLSQNNKVLSGDVNKFPVDIPVDELPESYELVVSDLHEQTNDDLGLNGKYAFELKQEYKRFSNPDSIHFNSVIALEQDAFVYVAYKINKDIAIAIDNTSHTIPEVRAGPNV